VTRDILQKIVHNGLRNCIATSSANDNAIQKQERTSCPEQSPSSTATLTNSNVRKLNVLAIPRRARVRQFQCAGDFNKADLGGSRVLFIKATPSKFTLVISFSFLR
jgi:hypothetical protein